MFKVANLSSKRQLCDKILDELYKSCLKFRFDVVEEYEKEEYPQIYLTYNLDVVIASVGGECLLKYFVNFNGHKIDRKGIMDAIECYYPPHCEDAWILTGVNFAKKYLSHDNYSYNIINVHARDGAIILNTFRHEFDQLTSMVITKNSFEFVDTFGIMVYKINFEKPVVVVDVLWMSFKNYTGDEINNEGEHIATFTDGFDDIEELSKKIRYAYMDTFHRRKFIGLEDVKIIFQHDESSCQQ